MGGVACEERARLAGSAAASPLSANSRAQRAPFANFLGGSPPRPPRAPCTTCVCVVGTALSPVHLCEREAPRATHPAEKLEKIDARDSGGSVRAPALQCRPDRRRAVSRRGSLPPRPGERRSGGGLCFGPEGRARGRGSLAREAAELPQGRVLSQPPRARIERDKQGGGSLESRVAARSPVARSPVASRQSPVAFTT